MRPTTDQLNQRIATLEAQVVDLLWMIRALEASLGPVEGLRGLQEGKTLPVPPPGLRLL